MNEIKISRIEEILEQLRENICFVKFKKKDNTEKVMVCTLNFNYFHKDFYPKNQVNQSNRDEVIRVFDIEGQSWKSIIFANIIYVRTKEYFYTIEFKGEKKDG